LFVIMKLVSLRNIYFVLDHNILFLYALHKIILMIRIVLKNNL